jgi:hypothetical protein
VIATARVQPAEAARILTGKHDTINGLFRTVSSMSTRSKVQPEAQVPATIASGLANFQQRFTSPMKLVPQKKRATLHWSAWPGHSQISACIPFLLLIGASCSRNDAASVLNPVKVAHVVVGQSSRADVFATLGRPTRTERNSSGESWIYEDRSDAAGRRGILQGAAAASGIIGAFVPYAGLAGSGLGLAGAAMDGISSTGVTSLAVEFGANGVVRECVFSSTAVPAGVPEIAAAAPIDCQRSTAKGHG